MSGLPRVNLPCEEGFSDGVALGAAAVVEVEVFELHPAASSNAMPTRATAINFACRLQLATTRLEESISSALRPLDDFLLAATRIESLLRKAKHVR